MNSGHASAASRILRKYAELGALGGLGLGAVAGILASGPYFHEWELSQSLSVIVSAAAVGSGVGWLAIRLILGSLLGGAAESSGEEVSGKGTETGAHRSGDSDYAWKRQRRSWSPTAGT